MSDDDNILSRWSRRKQSARTAPEPPEAASPVTEAPPDERTEAEVLADLGLPDPAALTPGDDIRGFMQDAVPARLRRQALRHLWRSNPALAGLDGLVDYGEDYTDAATVVENLQTAYRVGRGFWTDEDEAMAAAAEEATDAEPDAASGETAMSDPEAVPDQPVAPDDVPDDPAPPDETASATARRMTFHYES